MSPVRARQSLDGGYRGGRGEPFAVMVALCGGLPAHVAHQIEDVHCPIDAPVRARPFEPAPPIVAIAQIVAMPSTEFVRQIILGKRHPAVSHRLR